MPFNSVTFLFVFFPLAIFFYYLAPGKAKNAVLLLESIVFYAWGAIRFLPLALFLASAAYGLGRLLSGQRGKRRIGVFWAGVLLDLGLLFLFKYHVFVSGLLGKIGTSGLSSVDFFDVLPLGISYYSFKCISYLADVCTGRCKQENNYVDFLTYVLLYPQMIVGPIARYRDMEPSLHRTQQRCTVPMVEQGVKDFVIGLAKKVILADQVGRVWSGITGPGGIGLSNASTLLTWFGVVSFSLQLYFDFSGYSDMSNGLSQMMGIAPTPNFNQPYQSASITEFWRRWHISLSNWFRDYLYIPMGGNRKGPGRMLLAMFLVWMATGIWHGSTLNFLVWGFYYFCLLVLEKYALKKFVQTGGMWTHVYTLVAVAVGWGIFAADNERVPLILLLRKLFCFQGGIPADYYLRSSWLILAICVLSCCGLLTRLWEKRRKPTQAILLICLYLLCVAYIIAGTSQTALYAMF